MSNTIDIIEAISQKAQDATEMPWKAISTDIIKDYEDSQETAVDGENAQPKTDLEKAVEDNARIIEESWVIRKEYLANRIRSSEIQSAIIKGLKEGESIYSLFLQALKCISLMIDDETILLQAEKDIRAIYGEGLEDPEPLQMCIDQVTERLTRLRFSLGQCQDAEHANRISQAIKAHKAELAILKKKKTGE